MDALSVQVSYALHAFASSRAMARHAGKLIGKTGSVWAKWSPLKSDHSRHERHNGSSDGGGNVLGDGVYANYDLCLMNCAHKPVPIQLTHERYG